MPFLLEKEGEELSRKSAFIVFSITASMGQID